MKKSLPIWIMLLIATTAYSQSSTRTSSSSQNSNTENKSTRTSTNSVNSTSTDRNRSITNNQGTNTQGTHSSTRTSSTSANSGNTSNTPRSYERSGSTSGTSSTGHTNSRPVVSNNPDYSFRTSTSSNTTYTSPKTRVEYASPRVYHEHHEPVHYYNETPRSKTYRSTYHVYRAPVNYEVVWTSSMCRHYTEIYPMVHYWDYPYGYRIPTISAYDAEYYMGQVITIYGRVTEVFYSRSTDEYFLYMGLYYPYQDFTVVMPGWLARRYSSRPTIFFDNQYINTTGLVTSFEGSPEIVVRKDYQVNLY